MREEYEVEYPPLGHVGMHLAEGRTSHDLTLLRTGEDLPVPRTPNLQPSCTSNPLSGIGSTTAQPSSVTAQPIPAYV